MNKDPYNDYLKCLEEITRFNEHLQNNEVPMPIRHACHTLLADWHKEAARYLRALPARNKTDDRPKR